MIRAHVLGSRPLYRCKYVVILFLMNRDSIVVFYTETLVQVDRNETVVLSNRIVLWNTVYLCKEAMFGDCFLLRQSLFCMSAIVICRGT